MAETIVIRRGLTIPIAGAPVQDIKQGPEISRVALLADDYLGMRPSMLVQVGDRVKLGQPVFGDKKNEGVVFTAPCSGRVAEINRAEKRRFVSMVFDVEGDDDISFAPPRDLSARDAEATRKLLLDSGLWTSFRTRPYNKVPAPGSEPHSVFVTAIDTNPLAAEPELIIEGAKDFFVAGLKLISGLTRGKTFVCTRDNSRIPGREIPGVVFQAFAGPHPAGLPGTHIHFLDPVGPKKTVWFINYQDVIAIGQLALTGKLSVERVVALGGPQVKSPALYRTRLGADLNQFVGSNVIADATGKVANRVISGSILSGRKAEPMVGYLGRYHLQVSVLKEGTEREFLGWQKPGGDKFSVTKAYLGSWLSGKLFPLTTSLGGSKRAIVPIGTYERVMPLDTVPTHLLKALITHDTDSAQALGCLEMDEDDLGLCTFVCPGKYDYGTILRENLQLIEKEG
jgi:Na+-transporting NADH:ubiquinone oxidoreductase subunit A